MSVTLPLFDDLEPAADQRPPSAESVAPPQVLPEWRAEQHLRAARRLAREIRRLPERSPAQTRAGLAICGHLQALLAAASGH